MSETTENTETTVEAAPVAAPVMKEAKVSRILIEILAFGVEENKPKLKNLLDLLNMQMRANRRAVNRIRILWYIDKGEKTDEEKKQLLIENAKCKFYIFAPDENKKLDKHYIKNLLLTVQNFENAFKSMKYHGITISKQKPEPQEAPVEVAVSSEEVKTEMKIIN